MTPSEARRCTSCDHAIDEYAAGLTLCAACDLTYSLSIKGEQHIYGVEAWAELDADQLCAILADLTGYRVDYLRRTLPDKFDKLGYAVVHPAAIGGWGEPPAFHVRSKTGAKMPAVITTGSIAGEQAEATTAVERRTT